MDKLRIKHLAPEQVRQRVGHMDQLAGIKLMESQDGLSKNSRLLQVWTGSGLTYTVAADRAMDISACHFNGISLSWISSVGESHPAFYEPNKDKWLRNFGGGLLVTCGLDQFGYPNLDENDELGLHGRVSNIPCRYLAYRSEWRADRYELEISGQVRQSQVFGENLVLERRILSTLGENSIQIEDRVTNQGYQPHPHMMLYHFNLGFPLLDEQSVIRANVSSTHPRDHEAEMHMDEWMKFHAPQQNFEEQVFQHQVSPDSDGFVKVEVFNERLGLGLRLKYSNEELPYLYEWKMLGQGTYVLGVEPANCAGMHGRAEARAKDQLVYLAPGENRRYGLTLEVFEE